MYVVVFGKKIEIRWRIDPCSCESNFNNCLRKPEKSELHRGLTCDFEIAVQRLSNQLRYEASDGDSWLFVSPNFPEMNESIDEVIEDLNPQ